MVEISQIKKDHSSYSDEPPLQHRTKDIAPQQQAHIGIAASWLKLRLQTYHLSSLML